MTPGAAQAGRPTVTISGGTVQFYPSHLLLDARAGASLDDGLLHVTADHITLDLRTKRYVAVGNVTVRGRGAIASAGATPTASPIASATPTAGTTPAPTPTDTMKPTATSEPTATALPAATPPPTAAPTPAPETTEPATAATPSGSAKGDVFAEDIAAQRGLLVALDATPSERPVADGVIGTSIVAPEAAGVEPLALPDFGNETVFATATRAVAHVGSDVRLTGAKVLVPGSASISLPSYVYLYSSDPGYTVSNFVGASEDVPLFFGSTRNSVQGIHFIYRPDVHFSFGLDERIVNGPKGYVLLSGAPLTGNSKALTATWQDAINSHTQQTLTSTSLQGFGTTNGYDIRDGVHRSFFEIAAAQFHSDVTGNLAWQSYDEAPARNGALSHLIFHLRSEYGIVHTPLQFGFPPLPTDVYLPQNIYHLAGEAYLATQPLTLGPATTTYASADARYVHDTLPHNLSAQIFALTLNQRMNRYVTLGASMSDIPIEDGYPYLNAVYASHLDTETATFSYNRSSFFSLLLSGTHATASTQLPTGIIATPWSAAADVRFRLVPTLSMELGRSYFFGFEGQRFGTWTFQIFP